MTGPVRYLIAEPTPDARGIVNDWDGEIYNDRATAERELAAANGTCGCSDDGHWRLYAVVALTDWDVAKAGAEQYELFGEHSW